MLVRPCRPIAGDTSVKRPVALACHHVDTAGLRGVSPACSCESRNQRSEEHTSELQSLMRISYAVFCLKKKTIITDYKTDTTNPIAILIPTIHMTYAYSFCVGVFAQ